MTRPAFLALLLATALPVVAAEPPATLLVNGSFELLEGGRPVGWELVEGARNREGSRASDWFFGAPAQSGLLSLKLQGTETTASWTLVRSLPVAVEPGRLLRVSAWMRTRGVRKDGNQWTNSNVGLAFETADNRVSTIDGYPVAGTPPLLGSSDWTRVERIVRVPPDAARVRVTCFLSLSGEAWFDDVGLEWVVEPDWTRVETDRFVFFEAPGARLTDSERARNEDDLAALEAVLGLRVPQKVQYYRYASEEQKRSVTGRAGIGHAELPGRIHSVRASHPHELVHLLTATVGPPESVLFGEGLAVHLAGGWQGRTLEEVVRELNATGRLPSLPTLADEQGFASLPDSITYPVAGSFVRFLVATGGLPTFKQIYPRHGRESSPATLEARLQEIYGAGLAELETRWRAAVLGEATPAARTAPER